MSTCRSCGARIAWVTTEYGKKMPIDQLGEARMVQLPNGSWGSRTAHKSHFATCPNADQHRRSR